jgi:hypothetical protein
MFEQKTELRIHKWTFKNLEKMQERTW